MFLNFIAIIAKFSHLMISRYYAKMIPLFFLLTGLVAFLAVHLGFVSLKYFLFLLLWISLVLPLWIFNRLIVSQWKVLTQHLRVDVLVGGGVLLGLASRFFLPLFLVVSMALVWDNPFSTLPELLAWIASFFLVWVSGLSLGLLILLMRDRFALFKSLTVSLWALVGIISFLLFQRISTGSASPELLTFLFFDFYDADRMTITFGSMAGFIASFCGVVISSLWGAIKLTAH